MGAKYKHKIEHLSDEQRQEKINNTIIEKHHFKSERVYYAFHKAALKHGYKNANDFIKQEYFNTQKSQTEVAEMANCKCGDLSVTLCKADLLRMKKYKGELKRKYKKKERDRDGYKLGRMYKAKPNTVQQTEKWYECTNCGKKTRNRMLCDYCYTHADNEIEYDEHKMHVDY